MTLETPQLFTHPHSTFVHTYNWSQSCLGPVTSWPDTLIRVVNMVLASRLPFLLFWGQELAVIYNGACIPYLGSRHPHVLGKAGLEAWKEVWEIINPMFELAFRGEGGWLEDQLFELTRNNHPEECYFTCSFSPIYNDDGTIGGVLAPLIETTGNVLSVRRAKILCGIQYLVSSSMQSTCEDIMDILKSNHFDIPFALLYLINNEQELVLTETLNITKGSPAAPAQVSLKGEGDGCWPFHCVLLHNQYVEVDQLEERFGPLHGGAWRESPKKAVVIPLSYSSMDSPCGIFIVGVYA